MERKSFEDSPCSIARSLDVLGDWWNPLILRECLYGVRRFDHFQRWLGIGRNVLTRRLNHLLAEGLLERKPYQTRPIRHEYHLTQKGHDAAKVILAIVPFGEEHYFAGASPIELYSRSTGRRVRPLVVDAETGDPIDTRDLYAAPGPAFVHGEDVQRERFVEHFQRSDDTAWPSD